MKVLIGVDGSASAFAAVRQVGDWLSAEQDDVALYYTPPEIKVHDGGETGPEIRERAREALAKAVFSEALADLPERLRPCSQTILGTKTPRQGLLLAADDWRADLIVVGARGTSPISQLMVGGVSRTVVQRSQLPVLVVRPKPDSPDRKPLRVLLAYDGSAGSRHAGDLLNRFAWPPGTSGRVITVVESLLAGAIPQWLEEKARDADSEAMARAWVEEHEAEKRQARDELIQYCQKLPLAFHGSEPIVAEGHAAEQILKAVVAEDIDLVVMGAQGKKTWERLLIGSTSHDVLNAAPCSVLIVRDRPQP